MNDSSDAVANEPQRRAHHRLERLLEDMPSTVSPEYENVPLGWAAPTWLPAVVEAAARIAQGPYSASVTPVSTDAVFFRQGSGAAWPVMHWRVPATWLPDKPLRAAPASELLARAVDDRSTSGFADWAESHGACDGLTYPVRVVAIAGHIAYNVRLARGTDRLQPRHLLSALWSLTDAELSSLSTSGVLERRRRDVTRSGDAIEVRRMTASLQEIDRTVRRDVYRNGVGSFLRLAHLLAVQARPTVA